MAEAFVSSVLDLNPQIAVFDCDGTLWAGDSGADFLYWEIERGLLPKPVAEWARKRYDEYLAGNVSELDICGEMVTIHKGILEEKIAFAATDFFDSIVAPRIFAEMRELVQQLNQQGCQTWAVSSTNEWVVRAGARRFGIPAERVLAVSVDIENGFVTDRLLEVPTDEGKAASIRVHILGQPHVVFGNSVHDEAMLELAGSAFAVNPNPDLAATAHERKWTIYWPMMVRQSSRPRSQ
jgi:HAD superfamily phosphoserine phosphatase-like hydrolase